ncbi:hypothetical protein QO010_003367 [Caulobacter ginsengisoli]|uniref:Restriction endonuclease n=1 Tax=Caulobacter ginsengisoli TaxID=400775 RepID=A0ABU0IU92_9CAUL|nr:hypothetical protein [Caulobacter ginsengisoli]MDQ0465578.1 hypothetical protein [Caulobacter ginsengisoli]
MDSSEQLVEAYLKHLDIGEVVYEPDGNVPPDFLVDGRIAVEVRRLNQTFERADAAEGLETGQATIIGFLKGMLPKYGAPLEGRGWWVSVYFWRPFDWKRIKREIRAALAALQKEPPLDEAAFKFGNFEMDVRRAGIPTEHYFMLGALADRDAGGFVGAEIIRNLNLCVSEKARKVAPHRARYPEWWLVLPDHIGADLNAEERSQLSPHVSTEGWDKVILLHPNDHTRGLEM